MTKYDKVKFESLEIGDKFKYQVSWPSVYVVLAKVGTDAGDAVVYARADGPAGPIWVERVAGEYVFVEAAPRPGPELVPVWDVCIGKTFVHGGAEYVVVGSSYGAGEMPNCVYAINRSVFRTQGSGRMRVFDGRCTVQPGPKGDRR